MPAASAITVPALGKQTATIIVAHGLGDSGAGWSFVAEHWRRKNKFKDVKFIFPNAPTIPITVNFGMQMPGWYDITTFDKLAKDAHDEPGIMRSKALFEGIIKGEVDAGIPSNKIILGGFSQGGAVSLFIGLTTTYKLGGVFGLSSYLLLGEKIKMLSTDANKDTPFFMGHGTDDPLVKYEWGTGTADAIKELGRKVEFKSYKGVQHSADMGEIDDLERFITGALGESST